jgi:hypothetical protein
VREVRASEPTGDTKMRKLVVIGIAIGAEPRKVADQYRVSLLRDLGSMFRGTVGVRFEQFDDLPDSPSAVPGGKHGTFTIVATIRPDENAETRSGGGA